MNLRDLVGRMAIRTDKVREVMPWEMERAFRLDFMVPVPIFDREKYMDEPVRILAVEGTQVVIEEDGKRKLLERRYIDERWTDYERLLHPEEEEKEKAEKLMKEFEVAAEPIKHFLAEHYDPMCTAVISMDNIQIFRKATNEAVKAVDNKIAEKILEAEGTIQATVDQFIANVCEEKIGKIVIPEKKSTWSDEVTYKPLSEYVGERFELFLTEKRYDRDGRIASYSSDRKLSAAGLLTSRYLEEELGKKVEKLIANAKREVEESLIKSLEQNLKENLAKDTIERMNIPEVLKKLSSIGAKQVTGTSLPE